MEKEYSIEKSRTIKYNMDTQHYDMLVFCHLRWDFVYQRPQHIISRLANNYKVLVVEEPIGMDGEIDYELEHITPQLTILRPKVKSILEIRNVLKMLNIHSVDIAWFYSAAFVELLPVLNVETIIYDCMDELSQFKGASPTLRQQEQTLIDQADVIFTGGKSLYEAKSKLSANVYCFPSSVDVDHFRKAKDDETAMPSDIEIIAQPIVGYIGVIDERINLELLKETARAMPEVSFVMIGPLAKLSDTDLPKGKNIHYLGMKKYGELPQYLKAFDIAMMPFALNEATQYISPTKKLEYMAAGLLIISTPIKDVVRDYKNEVSIIHISKEFVNAIGDFMTNKETKSYDSILAKTSWDATVKSMISILKKQTV